MKNARKPAPAPAVVPAPAPAVTTGPSVPAVFTAAARPGVRGAGPSGYRLPRVPSLRASLVAALAAGVAVGGKGYPGLVAVLPAWANSVNPPRLAVEALRILNRTYGYGFTYRRVGGVNTLTLAGTPAAPLPPGLASLAS